MNEFVDMHVHSKFSIDGMSTMEDYCLIAGKTGTRVICFTEHAGESGVLSARRKDLNNINYSRLRFEVHPEWISLQKSSFVTYLELSQDDLYISSDLS